MSADAPGALRYLVVRSLANGTRRRVGRLRRPRYAVALLLGIGYFGLVFWPSLEDPVFAPDETRPIAALAVALFLAWAWLWGGYRSALALSPAETHLLVPAPLTRRALIAFKLARVQPAILFSAALITLLAEGSSPGWPLRLPALYVLLATMNLHQAAASLVHASAEEQGRAGARRNRVALAVFAIALLLLATALVPAVARLRTAAGAAEAIGVLADALRAPAAAAALLPVRLLLAPTFADDAASWLRAMGPALLVLVLHAVWVFRTDAAFEEGAVEAGHRRAQRAAAAREGRRLGASAQGTRPRRSLALPRRGPPAVAIVWKNLIAFARGMRGASLALIAILAMVGGVATAAALDSAARLADAVALTALPLAALLTVIGPLFVRNDLRHDLGRLELLRTLPLRGRDVVGAEVASSTLTLSALQLPLVVVGVLAAASGERLGADATTALLAIAAAVLALPPLNALALLIQNGLALSFPGWVRIGDSPPGGVEFMGQQLLTVLGAVVLLGAGLLAPLVGAGAAAAALAPAGEVAAAAGAVAALAALLVAEVVVLVAALGRTFERTDPAEAGIASA